MVVLKDEQVQFILNDIRRNGIETEDLQLSLLDHICCVIEDEWSANLSFEEKYSEILPRFFKKDLSEIQEETELLLTFKNYYAMKKIMIISGGTSAFGFFIGAIFKIMHWPGAAVLMVLAVVTFSFLFLPILFTLKSRETKLAREKWTLGIGTIVGILFCLSILFKVMHWPGANVMGVSALTGLVFVFLPLHFFVGIRNPETKISTIISSIILLAISGLLFLLVNIRGSKASDDALFLAINNSEKSNQALEGISQDYVNKSDNAKVKEIAAKTGSILESIKSFRAYLLNSMDFVDEVSDGDAVQKEGKNFVTMKSLLFDNKGLPTSKLTNFKKELLAYQKFASTNLESKEILSPSFPVQMDDNWEEKMFLQVNLEGVLRHLNQMKLDVEISQLAQLLSIK